MSRSLIHALVGWCAMVLVTVAPMHQADEDEESSAGPNGGRGLEGFNSEYCLGSAFARIKRAGKGDLLLSSGLKREGGGPGLTLLDALDGSFQMFSD